MTPEEIKESLAECNQEALLADGFDEALVGIARRCGQPVLAVYDIEKCVQILMDRDGKSRSQAWEDLEYNVIGAWMGEHTPVWLER